jgi:hypothetical protein
MPFTSLTTATQAGELKVFAATTNDFPGFKNTTNGGNFSGGTYTSLLFYDPLAD